MRSRAMVEPPVRRARRATIVPVRTCGKPRKRGD
jgi:hypothetical protein